MQSAKPNLDQATFIRYVTFAFVDPAANISRPYRSLSAARDGSRPFCWIPKAALIATIVIGASWVAEEASLKHESADQAAYRKVLAFFL